MERRSTHSVQLEVKLPNKIYFTLTGISEEGGVWTIVSTSEESLEVAEQQVLDAIGTIGTTFWAEREGSEI